MSAAEQFVLEGDADEMSWRIRHDAENAWFEIVTEGRFTPAAFGAMQGAVVSHPAWTPGTDVLIDHRKLDLGDVGFRMMAEAAQRHEANDERIGDGRAAIVMSDLRGYGVGRIFQGVTDGHIRARIRLFLEMVEAVDWLGTPSED